MGIVYNTSIVRNGLVLHLDAANRKSYPGSGTVWNDLSGNGNNGTLVNGSTFTNGYFSFDGVDDYTTIPIPGNVGSISFWYYYNQDTTQKLIMGNSNSMIYCGGGAGSGHWYNMGVDYSFAFSWGNVSQWLHMCAVYESTTNNRFYINGNLAYSSTIYALTKGTIYNVAGNFYNPQNCRFSTISVYNRALTATEVTQNFNALRRRYGI